MKRQTVRFEPPYSKNQAENTVLDLQIADQLDRRRR
jgi:hypothetical protein